MASSFGSEGLPANGPKECPNADDLCAALDLAVQAFDRVGRVQLCPVFLGEGHVSQHVVLGVIHQRGEFGHLGPDLIGDCPPLCAGRFGGVPQAKAVAMKAETTLRPLFPAWARALRWKWTRHLCQVALRTFETAALMPSWASLMTSFTPRRPRRVSLREATPSRSARPRTCLFPGPELHACRRCSPRWR